MAPRSRTGCMTCRQRKLKCDEQRPVCGQCHKAKRECIPSSGITFRHQQNPSLNGAQVGRGSGGGLESFYGYKETFRHGTTWVRVPQELTFVHISNPYEDEEDGAGGGVEYSGVEGDPLALSGSENRFDDNGVYSGLVQAAQAAYPAYATHGLEALSAVASQDQYSYAPPPSTMGHLQSLASPGQQMEPNFGSQNGQSSTSPNIDFMLNHRGSATAEMLSGNIDPRLHAESSQAGQEKSSGEYDAQNSVRPTLGPVSLEEELRMRIQG